MQRINLTHVLALLAGLSAPAAPAGQWTKDKVRPAAGEPSAAFSPDGRSLALLDGKGAVHTWDVATGKAGKKITLALGPDESAEQVRYTPAGDLGVLLCRYKGFKSGPGWFVQGKISACLWNLSSGKRSPFVEVGYGGLAVCPRGTLLAYDEGLWEIATGKKLRTVALPKGLVYEIGFSPDGKAVAYEICESLAQEGSLIFVADAATGKKLFQVGEFDWDRYRFSFVCGGVFTPDGKAMACSEPYGSSISLYEVAAGKALRKFSRAKPESVVGFLPDGRSLISWHRPSGTVHLWESTTGKQRPAMKVGAGVETVLLSPDGKTLAVRKGKAVAFRSLTE